MRTSCYASSLCEKRTGCTNSTVSGCIIVLVAHSALGCKMARQVQHVSSTKFAVMTACATLQYQAHLDIAL